MNDQTKELIPVEKIGGGECTPQELIDITTQLTDAYESLVAFSSHVIGRVLGE